MLGVQLHYFRHRTQKDWRYWVFTSIISDIEPKRTGGTGGTWYSPPLFQAQNQGLEVLGIHLHYFRHRTQEDWRYWVFTSIMGHFVHTFAQQVSNINQEELGRSAVDWIQVKQNILNLFIYNKEPYFSPLSGLRKKRITRPISTPST